MSLLIFATVEIFLKIPLVNQDGWQNYIVIVSNVNYVKLLDGLLFAFI